MKLINIGLIIIMAVFPLTGFNQVKNDGETKPLSLKEYPLRSKGVKEYPFTQIIEKLMESPAPQNWKTSGIGRGAYLEMMNKIVRMAAGWVDKDGAVIDPFYKAEFAQTTPRFVSSAAVLLHFGMIGDLKPVVLRAMTYSCSQLANQKAESPDFWMRELSTAYVCLKSMVPQDLSRSWAEMIRMVDPEKTYKIIDPSGQRLDQLNNWAVYSSGGEAVREALGLTSQSNKFLQGSRFFDRYMKPQLVHFTKEGMYRDPNDPITYDITTRLQIANALVYGYDGILKDQFSELLQRGGLSMLLFTSPLGLAPYGGRSGQFNFQEAILAALSEVEASRYKETDKKLAGAFKRQAHLSAISVRRWIMEMDPIRHLKNGFAPELQHGIDEYGKYSVYALYCSSVLGLAALFADDEIEEFPCPSEKGGYLIELYPAFHKIFATTRNSHIEIDTKADLNFESTGLGRFHVKNVPPELGLNMSFTATPHYGFANDTLKPADSYAIGPAWKSGQTFCSLARLSKNLTHIVNPVQVNKDTIEFVIKYNSPENVSINQHYKMYDQNLNISCEIIDPVNQIDSIFFTIPLLVSNGLSGSRINRESSSAAVFFPGHRYLIHPDDKSEYTIDKDLFANRNGIYRNLLIKRRGNKMKINLRLE